MEILIDMHNHTLSSGHAYSTILEIAQEASNKGMKYIGITDHGPSMQGAANIWHIGNLRVIPNTIYGVEVLIGVEANIINEEGHLDVPESYLKNLDIVLAGFHEGSIKPADIHSNTNTVLQVMENKYVDIVVHLGNPRFPIDMKKVVLKAKETNTLLEINNSSLLTSRAGSEENCYEIALLCKEYGVPIIVNSDSHFALDVGNVEMALKLLKAAEMPEELIVNSSIERFQTYMKMKGKERFI
ncbi:MAG: phosphatase [Tissierellia bacterium]|jgi:putative hydrolase|nr:phosphatase [Tissierellia bacterium]